MAAYIKGINNILMGDANIVADLVPVDFVVNGTLLSAMKTAHDYVSRRNSLGYDSENFSDSENSTDLQSIG